jgi:hypothetical protein
VYRGRVARVAGSGLRVGRHGLFVTLTAPGSRRHRRPDGQWCPCTPRDDADLGAWNATLGRRWTEFVQALSRELGADLVTYDDAGKRHREFGLAYFAAREVQRRGALHLHVLVRRRDGRPAALTVSQLRALAVAYGFGHAVDVQRLDPDRHVGYVAKYVSKSASDRRRVPWTAQQWARIPGEIVAKTPRGYARFSRATGEHLGPAVPALVCVPRYRTWSASRTWGDTMASVRAAQQHYVMTLERLPDWRVAPPRPAWALAAPDRPDDSPPVP